MTTKTTILASVTAAAVAAGLLITPVAEARGGPQVGDGARGHMPFGQAAPSFSDLDVDGSGGITAEDLEALRVNRFAEMDADGNGTVSADELTAHTTARMAERIEARSAQMIERMDTDGDGALSQDELLAQGPGKGHGDPGAMLIERADADKDGTVTEDEFNAAMQRFQHRMPGGGHGGHGPRKG